MVFPVVDRGVNETPCWSLTNIFIGFLIFFVVVGHSKLKLLTLASVY